MQTAEAYMQTEPKAFAVQICPQDTILHGTAIHISSKCSDRKAWANNVDPDQMLQNAASDHGLPCLPLI